MFRGIGTILGSQLRSTVSTKLRCYSYESDISLKVLYSNSSLKLTSPSPPSPNEDGKFNGFIPMNKISVTYSRSTGPGGQNVNKIATKVDLRFHVKTADWISEAVRNKMLNTYKNKINRDGYFIIKSELTRYQHLNLADALERVRNIIRDLEKKMVPLELSEEKLAKIQRNHEKAARERLFIKRARSDDKKNRQAGQNGHDVY